MLRGEPYGVTTASPDCAPWAWPKSGCTPLGPKEKPVFDVRTHRGEANYQLEIGRTTARSAAFFTSCISPKCRRRSGFLVEVGRGENDVGEPGSLRKEHILHDKEGVAQNVRVDAIAGDWICAHDIERAERATLAASNICGRSRPGWGAARIPKLRRTVRIRERGVAGKQIGVQAMSAAAARIGVLGEAGELRIGSVGPNWTSASMSWPRNSEPKTMSSDLL